MIIVLCGQLIPKRHTTKNWVRSDSYSPLLTIYVHTMKFQVGNNKRIGAPCEDNVSDHLSAL